MAEEDYLKKLEETKECDNAKQWHEIFMEDAEQFSRKLKDREKKRKDDGHKEIT